jgi:hypothetical protein
MPITLGSSLFASTQDDLSSQGVPLTEEERIIKHHLGDAFSASEVRAMKGEERAELLLRAKTQIVAERYGRHRVKPGARAKSPPGFWDTDMPTTQDVAEQHAEVERRNRETVAERWREAMRKGGRWIFRDE